MANKSFTTETTSSINRSFHDFPKRPQTTFKSKVSVEDMTYGLSKGNEFGIEGYACPKHGRSVDNPKWGFTKDKTKSFLDKVVKRSKELPCPTSHHKPVEWQSARGKFLKEKRMTLIESNAIKTKSMPGPGAYNPAKKQKIQYGFTAKSNRNINYISEAQYLSSVTAAPDKYNPDFNKVKPRTPYFKYSKPKDKETWKPSKSKDPDVGSYEEFKSLKFTKPRTTLGMILKSKAEKFTDIAVKSNKGIPGAGQYEVEKPSKMISKPMKSYY